MSNSQDTSSKDSVLTSVAASVAPQSPSAQLLRRAQAGDAKALDELFSRYLPGLHRWAHGRLPKWARAFSDTADLVQDAVLRTVRGIDRFEPRLERALQAYLRQAVQNRILDELRRAKRQPFHVELDASQTDGRPSPYDETLDQENQDRYRLALERLTDEERQLIVARLELGYSYEQVALVAGRSTPDAARVATRRAVKKLAEEMKRVELAKSDQ